MKEHENQRGALVSLSEAIVYGDSPLERHSIDHGVLMNNNTWKDTALRKNLENDAYFIC